MHAFILVPASAPARLCAVSGAFQPLYKYTVVESMIFISTFDQCRDELYRALPVLILTKCYAFDHSSGGLYKV